MYNGTLYMNFMPRIRDAFFADAETNIAAADARWTSLWGKLEVGISFMSLSYCRVYSFALPCHDLCCLYACLPP